MSFITVLTVSEETEFRPSLAKTIYRDNFGNLEAKWGSSPKYFQGFRIDCPDVFELGCFLEKIAKNKYAVVVRGSIREGIVLSDWENCCLGDSFERTKKNLMGDCSDFLCLDFDKVPVPKHLRVAPGDRAELAENTEQLVEYAVSLLPDEFQDVSYCYGMSASFCVNTDTFSCHVWFQMDEIGNDEVLRRWGKWINSQHSFRLIDPAVFGCAQPIFTADPILEAGVALPYFKRHGIVEREHDTVTVKFPTRAQVASLDPDLGRGDAGRLSKGHTYESEMSALGDGEGLDGFYGPLTRAIGCYVRQYPDCDNSALWTDVCRRIDEAPRSGHTDEQLSAYKDKAAAMIVSFKAKDQIAAETELGEQDEEFIRTRRRFSMNEIDRRTAEARTSREIAKVFFGEESEGVTTLLKAPAGMGKTTTVAEQAALIAFSDPGCLIEIYVPSHENGTALKETIERETGVLVGKYNEVIKDKNFPLDTLNQTSVVKDIHRRSKDNCCKGDLVEKFNKMAEAYEIGAGFYTAHCKNCPSFGVCPYMQQFQTGIASEIHIYTHAHLSSPRITGKNRQPDYIVIDEDWTKGSVRIKSSITEGDMRSYCDHNPDLEHVSELTFDALFSNDLDKLRSTVSLEDLRCLQKHHDEIKRREMAFLSDPDMARGFEKAAQHNAKALAVLDCIIPQYHTARRTFNGVLSAPSLVNGKHRTICDNVSVASRKPLLRLCYADQTPFTSNMLLLDATAIPEVVETCLGRTVNTVAFDVRRNANVFQVTDSTFASSQSGFEGRVKVIHDCAVWLASERKREGKTVGFVAQRSVIKMLFPEYTPDNREWDGVVYGHFNALRGLNCWEEMNCHDLFVVGRVQPRTDELDLLAGGIYHDSADPLTLCPEGGLPEHEGLVYYNTQVARESKEARYSVHPDPRTNALLMSIRESEITQALDRARLIHNSEPKNVYLFCNIPVAVTVTQLVTERELLNRLGHNDNPPAVLPASGTWLKQIRPELSDKQARTEAGRIKASILKGGLDGYVAYWIRPAGSTRDFICAFDPRQGSVDVLAAGVFGEGVCVGGEIGGKIG